MREVALAKLRCPASGEPLVPAGDELATPSGKHRYALHAGVIPLLVDALGPQWLLGLPGVGRAGLQVVGRAGKSEPGAQAVVAARQIPV